MCGSLIKWNIVTIPKQWGGLGVLNLELRNCSLLLRWWWRAYKDPESLWSCMITIIRSFNQVPLVWNVKGLFFWDGLIKINHRFHWSAIWEVGNGCSIAYWYDNWGEGPLREYRDGLSRPFQNQMSLKEAFRSPTQSPQTKEMASLGLNDEHDVLNWRWTAQKEYSAASIYKIMVEAGKIKWRYSEIWKAKAPPKIQVFTYLLLQERILTRDVLRKRGIQCQEV